MSGPADPRDVTQVVAAHFGTSADALSSGPHPRQWGQPGRPLEARAVLYRLLRDECWLTWPQVAAVATGGTDGGSVSRTALRAPDDDLAACRAELREVRASDAPS